MSNEKRTDAMKRRDFMKTTVAAGTALWAGSTGLPKALAADGLDHRNERADRMTYRTLGRTNFMCSRLVFGCGAALAGGKAVRLLERAFESGINFYDVGYDDYYKGSEGYLAPFIERHKGDVWITSKAPARVESGHDHLTPELAKAAAGYWLGQLDKSLERLKIDYVDAYYVMGVNDPELVASEEIGNAFQAAKAAGKVGHAGISTHERAHDCLDAAVKAGWYSLAMIAVTPSGWYDYREKKLLDTNGSLASLKPVLELARQAKVGLIGMKAARYIAPQPYGGKYGTVTDGGGLDTFDRHYNERLMTASLSPFQRSYAYVLENGLDVVNADMQNFQHFEENLLATRTSHTYFA